MIRILALTIMLSLFSCSSKPAGDFSSYEFRKNGTRAFPEENYRLYRSESGDFLIDVEVDFDVVKTYPAPVNLPEKIDSIVTKYKLWRLKEHYKPPFQVLDGYSWTMRIRYEEGSIYSGGFNAWPRNKMRDGIQEINALISEALPKLPEQ